MRLNLKTIRWGDWEMHDQILPLELLHAGDSGDIADIDGEPSWINRMAELGVHIGSRLRVVQPGSPCLFQVGESRFSVRGECAMRILVRTIPIVY